MNNIKAIKDNHYIDECLMVEADKKDNCSLNRLLIYNKENI